MGVCCYSVNDNHHDRARGYVASVASAVDNSVDTAVVAFANVDLLSFLDPNLPSCKRASSWRDAMQR